MKLPRTLHIEGSRLPPGGHDPEAIQFNKLREQFLVIEEKVDGTGVSIELDSVWDIHINHRGKPAIGKEFHGLYNWADKHWEDLLETLGERYILFGEWMRNKHTIFYDNLPNFFLESDIYDKDREVWLSTSTRNDLLKKCDFIKRVPVLAAFKPTSIKQITNLLGKSTYQSSNLRDNLIIKCQSMGSSSDKVISETDLSGLMEGLYIKQEDDLQVINRYKFVRYEFLQTILNSGTHLIDRMPIFNIVSE